MAEPQLSVRSARARDIAQRENRTVAKVVERALELYEAREAGQEPPEAFYERLRTDASTDIDLERVIRENRRPHSGIDL